MINISHILEGWGNRIKDEFNLLDKETKNLSLERLLICDTCSIRSENSCSSTKSGNHIKTGELRYGCGCNLSAKALSPKSECPLGKW